MAKKKDDPARVVTLDGSQWSLVCEYLCGHKSDGKKEESRIVATHNGIREILSKDAYWFAAQDIRINLKESTVELILDVLRKRNTPASLGMVERITGVKPPRFDPSTEEQRKAAQRLRKEIESGELQ